jgi:predicted KAP-like P-loop ATPase
MKFLEDKEINLRKEDYLNAKTYADTLKEIIISHLKESAFSIGLYGQWGSGKSSIVKTVTDELEKEKGVKYVKYDAWKYTK